MECNERAWVTTRAGERLALIAACHERLAGEKLPGGLADPWDCPAPVLAHGTEPAPRFFYANRAALDLFGYPARAFIGMESRLSAAPEDRTERELMLDRLADHDIVCGYEGPRIAADGTRFVIHAARIWNLRDETGALVGQAALIPRWSRPV